MRLLLFYLGFIVLGACKQKSQPSELLRSDSKTIDTSSPEYSVYTVDNTCYYSFLYDSVPDKKQIEQLLKTGDSAYIAYRTSLPAYKYFIRQKKKWDAFKPLARQLGLPQDAIIIENEKIKGVKNRAIILWLENPCVTFEEDLPSCGRRTTGEGYFTGYTSFSLYDTEKQEIINTVTVSDMDCDEASPFVIPFLFSKESAFGYYSEFPSGFKDWVGVKILNLTDLNKDKLPHEFCLYVQMGCRYADKTMFAYDIETDSIYNYPTYIVTSYYDLYWKKDTTDVRTSKWVEKYFEYPDGENQKEFASAHYMLLGDGLPIYNVCLDKQEKIIKGTCVWHQTGYVLANDSLFRKYYKK